jgi:peroxiredoxin/Flp pilus assembly protein TadD
VEKLSATKACLLAAAFCLLVPPDAAALKDLGAGQKAPPFRLSDISGSTFTLEDFSGNPAAIVFWSTWSPRSEEVLEDFREYHRLYAEDGLRIVAVNIDGENLDYPRRTRVKSVIEEMDLPFPVLLDERLEAFVAYGVMAHPSAVVLDKEGVVAYALGGYPLSLREELKDNLLKVLGLYVEPARPEPLADLPPERSAALRQHNLGRRLMSLGQTKEALRAFDRASAADPAFFEPAVMAARLSLTEDDPSRAEKLLRNAGPEAVNRNDLRFLLGSLLLHKGKKEAATEIFAGLKKKSPREGWGAWGLGMVSLSEGNVGEALEWMREASAIQPASAEAEAALRMYLTKAWLRRESVSFEEDLLSLFPSLGELRERYQRMFHFNTPSP